MEEAVPAADQEFSVDQREERIPLVRVPTAVLYQPDPKVFGDLHSTAAAIPGAELAELPAGDQSQGAKAKVILDWLDRD